MKDQGWLWVFVSALAAIALAAVILLADLGHDLQRILLTVLLCFDGTSNLATLFYERIALKNYYRGAKVEVEVVDGERIEHRK